MGQPLMAALKLIQGLVLFAAFSAATQSATEELKVTNLNGELITVENSVKCDNKAKAGDKLTMHYTGTIDPKSKAGVANQKFDSSLDRGQPFSFTLGQGEVIKGWDKGLVGICPGEKRKLVIPPALGYGAQGAGGAIPGGATLDFTVECLKVN